MSHGAGASGNGMGTMDEGEWNAMKYKSQITEKEAAGFERRFPKFRDFAGSLLRLKRNEETVTKVLKLLLMFGDLEKAISVAKILSYRFEFPITHGRIDLLLFHKDGGISIIEAKSDGTAKEIAMGIGQLCLYEVGIQNKFSPKYINKILVAPLSPDKSIPLIQACAVAGARFAPIPCFEVLDAKISSPLRKLVA